MCVSGVCVCVFVRVCIAENVLFVQGYCLLWAFVYVCVSPGAFNNHSH